MSKQWNNALFVTLMIASLQAQAAVKDLVPDVKSWLPAPVLKTEGLKTVYGGAGFTNDFVHLNTELPTPYGTVYAKAGTFLSGSNDPAGLVGFRYPYSLTGEDLNGYYVGGFVGHISSDSIDNKEYNRLGLGGELSYVWMNSARISAASVGLGVGQRKTGKNGTEDKPKPMVLFSYSLNFGLY